MDHNAVVGTEDDDTDEDGVRRETMSDAGATVQDSHVAVVVLYWRETWEDGQRTDCDQCDRDSTAFRTARRSMATADGRANGAAAAVDRNA